VARDRVVGSGMRDTDVEAISKNSPSKTLTDTVNGPSKLPKVEVTSGMVRVAIVPVETSYVPLSSKSHV